MSRFQPEVKKYWMIFQLSWQNGLVYRTSLIIWRIRQMLSTLMALTIWSVVFTNQTSVFNYNQTEMTSYIFLVSILQSMILASSLHGLAGNIYSGQISHFLVKPQRIFATFAMEEIADKAKNVLFSLAEGALLYAIFQPLFLAPDFSVIMITLIWTLLGVLIHFYISIIFGTLGFWSPETWGPKFLFFMIVDFTAGKLYPLDILPRSLQNILMLTPFPYLSYVQIQLFLGRLDPARLLWCWIGIISWTFITWFFARTLWHKGAHSYDAAGQ